MFNQPYFQLDGKPNVNSEMASSTHPSGPSSTKDGYILDRDHYGATRLTCQHWVWHQELGYNIHPTVNIPENSRIADVAAGTGAWLLEVARQYPTSHCDGFDISLDYAPPLVWLPFNATFRKWDIYQPPPTELVGTYDIVHVRLLGIVVRNKDPVPILQNLARLLKPQGWLQWDEIDVSDSVIMHAAGEGGKTDAIQKMDRLMKGHGAPDWILKLPAFMLETGEFEKIKMHRVKPEPSMLKFHTDMVFGSWLEIASNQAEGSERKAEFEQLVIDLGNEIRQGAAQAVPKVICVGKKMAQLALQ